MGVPSCASSEIAPGELFVNERAPEFTDLARRYGVRVWRSLRYLGVRDADVADASQEVLLIVHRRLPEFRGDSKIETWLYGICLGVARNLRRKQLRAAGHVSEPPNEVFEPNQETELDQKRMRAVLARALDQISPEQREVFVLHEIEELGMRAVAQAVGCPLFTAYSRLRLARKGLRQLLLGYEGTGAR